MFLSRRISMLLLSIGCCFASLQADFVTLSVWERTTDTGKKQHLICLGDLHTRVEEADEQANDLVEFLRERNCESDCILVEDMFDFGPVLHYVKQYLKQHVAGCIKQHMVGHIFTNQRLYLDKVRRSTRVPALFKIAPYADEHRIRSINVEHRHLHSTYFPSFLRGLVNKVDCFMLNYILEELKAYDDNYALNQFYKDIVSRYADIKEMLQRQMPIGEIIRATTIGSLISRENPAYEDYRYNFPDENLFLKSPLKDTFFFNETVDAKFLHNIYQRQVQQERPSVVAVCAGATHTWNIERKLPALGYQCIHRDGASSLNDCRKGLSLSQRLKDILDELFVYQPLKKALYELLLHPKAAVEKIKKIEQQAQIKNAFDEQFARQQAAIGKERKIEQQAKIEKRIKHILLGFDVDMGEVQRSPAKLQAKL